MERSAEDQQAADRGIAASTGTPGEGEDIQDLLEVVAEGDAKTNQEVIVIDGRLYDRVRKPEDRIYELEDMVEQGEGAAFAGGGLTGEMAGIIAQAAEKIAREMVPAIAERVIREEIEKLKREHGMGTDH